MNEACKKHKQNFDKFIVRFHSRNIKREKVSREKVSRENFDISLAIH